MVYIVISGDIETLESASEALEKGFPVLVIDGTGGVADVMADVFKNKYVQWLTWHMLSQQYLKHLLC